jgi:hypothetical protein
MAITLKELRRWVDDFGDWDEGELLAIDEGGLTLLVQADHSIYIEIGGERRGE